MGTNKKYNFYYEGKGILGVKEYLFSIGIFYWFYDWVGGRMGLADGLAVGLLKTDFEPRMDDDLDYQRSLDLIWQSQSGKII
ncbi:MAG: hypothetical protein K9M57_07755 [Phycisphaerae bacterium]|nr:hypothetical protein [Phycisphaerae bacterium]